MKTLIELFDEAPIENVMSTDVFRPQEVIFLCPPEVTQDSSRLEKITRFLREKQPFLNVQYQESSQYNTEEIQKQLLTILSTHDDCAMDITGGTDNLLFAAGIVATIKKFGVFTYCHPENRYYNVSNAEFADGVSCTNLYSISDFVVMGGGRIMPGRAANQNLEEHFSDIDHLFYIYLKNKRKWPSIVSWIQQASKPHSLTVKNASYRQNNERGKPFPCPETCLKDLEQAGLISNLEIGERVSFTFKDQQIQSWLRDVGSALEVFTYKKAVESEVFAEVACSVIVEWNGDEQERSVYNEIDVMAVKDVTPFFISCKACNIDTYALNELEVLRKRFGGKYSKAIIVTTEKCSSRTRLRAAELDIQVIDFADIMDELRQ